VREILRRIGELPFDGGFHEIRVEGHGEEEITYHVMQLANAGLIQAVDLSSMDDVCWRPKHLTYAGEEFLLAAESDTVWKNAKGIGWQGSKTITLEGLKYALPLAVKALIPGVPELQS
jgi:uncharacterized protein DUF2513